MQKIFVLVHFLYQEGFCFLVRELEKKLLYSWQQVMQSTAESTTHFIKTLGQTLKTFMLLKNTKAYVKTFCDPNKTILVHSRTTYPMKKNTLYKCILISKRLCDSITSLGFKKKKQANL